MKIFDDKKINEIAKSLKEKEDARVSEEHKRIDDENHRRKEKGQVVREACMEFYHWVMNNNVPPARTWIMKDISFFGSLLRLKKKVTGWELDYWSEPTGYSDSPYIPRSSTLIVVAGNPETAIRIPVENSPNSKYDNDWNEHPNDYKLAVFSLQKIRDNIAKYVKETGIPFS